MRPFWTRPIPIESTTVLSVTAYTSILHTKWPFYNRRCSISILELHASSDWWATCISPFMHCNHFLVWHFLRTSGKHLCCATSLSKPGSKFLHSWDFRLVACIIHLTMLHQYFYSVNHAWSMNNIILIGECLECILWHLLLRRTICSQSRRKRTYFTDGWVAFNCPIVTVCCVTNLYKVLQLRHTKNDWNYGKKFSVKTRCM